MQQQLALQSDSNCPFGFIVNGKSVQSTVDLHQALIPNMGGI